MVRLIKFILSPVWFSSVNVLTNLKLLIKHKTLKLGSNVRINNSIFTSYNYLSTNVVISNSFLGEYSYLGESTKISNAKIGRFTCIGPNVLIGLGRHPIKEFVSIHPVFYSTAKQVGTSFVKENLFDEKPLETQIGNDVWIGANVIIAGGISIGDGAVIASGAVVTKNISAYSIVGGVPAKVLSVRFTNTQIEYLKEIKWWNHSNTWIKNHAKFFHEIEKFEENVK